MSSVLNCRECPVELKRPNTYLIATSLPGDPLHNGHIALLQELVFYSKIIPKAKTVVFVDDDGFLIEKKGYFLLPQHIRCNVILSVSGIDYVVPMIYPCNVSDCIKIFQPFMFLKGGDRNFSNLNKEELSACEQCDCRVMIGVGGYSKLYSSHQLFLDAMKTYNAKVLCNN